MTTLREFLANRRGEIQAEIKALREELREIEVTAIRLEGGSLPEPNKTRRGSTATGTKTLKEMAVIALEGFSTSGASAQTIIEAIKREFGKDVPRSSMSPQLSRLRSEGLIDLEGSLWRLVQPPLPKPAVPDSTGDFQWDPADQLTPAELAEVKAKEELLG
jgi:hypothetical protein